MSSVTEVVKCKATPECKKPVKALGLCIRHYCYFRNHGCYEPPDFDVQPLPIPAHEAAWLAAVLDCEGWIGMVYSTRKSGHAYWPRIGVGNTDYRLIQRLVDLTKVDSVRHVIPKSVKHKESWHWNATRRVDVIAILKSVLPYLVIKAEQAEAILDLPNRYAKNKKEREKVHLLCRSLNKKGPRAA